MGRLLVGWCRKPGKRWVGGFVNHIVRVTRWLIPKSWHLGTWTGGGCGGKWATQCGALVLEVHTVRRRREAFYHCHKCVSDIMGAVQRMRRIEVE